MSKIKDLFSTPLKGIMTSIIILAVLAVFGIGTAFAVEGVAESQSIGKNSAESRAFSDAGIDANDAIVSRTEFEREDGQYVYEIEFHANGVEYDYIINADDGAIIEKETEGQPATSQPSEHGTTSTETTSRPSTQETSPSEANLITAEQAKEIALQHAMFSTNEVNFIRSELDYDDGVQIYEIEFYKDNVEYDYEIDAATGSILSYDFDAEHYQPEPTQSTPSQSVPTPGNDSTYIGVDQAKSIAVSHAGLSVSDVSFLKAKLENDDGRAEYEIEFCRNGIEYEYTIDAISGSILEYDSEYDD